MSGIAAILLVPEEGDPLGLLAEGPCGARPPVVWERRGKWGRVVIRGTPTRRALVLAWGGTVAWQGVYATNLSEFVFGGSGWASHDYTEIAGKMAVAMNGGDWSSVEGFTEDLGTLILLDADGREVTP